MKNDDNIRRERIFHFKELVYILFMRWWILACVGIIFSFGMFYLSTYIMRWKYESKTKIYVLNRENPLSEITYSDLQISSQLLFDYMEILTSRMVTENLIQEFGLDLKHEELIKLINIENPTDTRIIIITVNYWDPITAKKIADNLWVKAAELMIGYQALEQVNLIEEANLPEQPSSPNVLFNTVVGGLLGICFCSFVIIIRYLSKDVINTAEEIEQSYHLPVLAKITLKLSKNLDKETNKSDKEVFQNFSNNVQYFGEKMNLIGVLGLDDTFPWYKIARKLAETISKEGKKALFIYTDMKMERTEFNKESEEMKGFSDYQTVSSISELIHTEAEYNLHIIYPGKTPDNSFTLLNHPLLKQRMNEFSLLYDYVILASPAFRDSNESLLISSMCDGMIVGLRRERDTFEQLNKMIDRFDHMESKFLGAVLIDRR